jgi:hypothetical protein
VTETFLSLEGASLDERIAAVYRAVDKKWNPQGDVAPVVSANSYTGVEKVFDDHVIIRRGDKTFSASYTLKDGEVTIGEPTEVKQTWVAAAYKKMKECHECKGTGTVKGNPCEACDGNGEMRAAGDVPGHEFHGNQYKDGEGSADIGGSVQNSDGRVLNESGRRELINHLHSEGFEPTASGWSHGDGTRVIIKEKEKNGKKVYIPRVTGGPTFLEARKLPIEHEGGKWVIKSRDKTRRLAEHLTEQAAKDHERAIRAALAHA